VLAYIVAGLVLGSVYAIAATGIVVTYSATRVVNFAQGAIAYAAAELYYKLHTTEGWSTVPSGVVTILIAGPVFGLLLWALLFRHARQMAPVVKIVATIGVLVALPAFIQMVFKHVTVYTAPGLAPQPPHVYHFGSVALNANEIIILASGALVAVFMWVLFRLTPFGLTMRAVVDRPEVAELHGTRTGPVEATAWMIGCTLAAFTGVLLAPIVGLDANNFTSLVIVSLASAVVAGLRSIPITFAVALAIGVVQSVLVNLAPSGGLIATAVQPTLPLIVLIAFLLIGPPIETYGIGATGLALPSRRSGSTAAIPRTAPLVRVLRYGAILAIAILVPLLLDKFWMAAVAAGLAMSVVFLSFTLLGIGGITSLGQAAYAGLGGFFTAFLITSHGYPALPAVIVGGLVAATLGLVVGLVTTRLGVLSLAIMTLAVAGFFDQFIVKISWLIPDAGGAIYSRPSFFGISFDPDRAFAYLMMVVFALGAFAVNRLRRGPLGLALGAVRSDETVSRAVGISPKTIRLLLFALSAFVAGVGGALLGMYQLQLGEAGVGTLSGLIWLAVVVTVGSRTPTAALVAGLSFSLAPAATTMWLPDSWSQAPAVLFGLGAIALASAPDGVLAKQSDALARVWERLRHRDAPTPGAPASGAGTPRELSQVRS